MKQLLLSTLLLLLSSCGPPIERESKPILINKHNLNEEQAYIMVRRGTERPFSSPLTKEKRPGVYVSAATGEVLFHSKDKFNSYTGWPSFDVATDKVALGPREQGGWEVIELSTGYHLGHLFINEGFTKNNKRYCINGDALRFIPD